MDLTKAKPEWLHAIELVDNQVMVKLEVPLREGVVAKLDEGISLGDSAPAYLTAATRAFVDACMKAVRERVVEKSWDDAKSPGEIPCTTCSSPCCGRVFNEVHVTDKDIERLRSVDPLPKVDVFREPMWSGFVGLLQRVPYKGKGEAGDGKACAYLGKDGWCTVYEHRPDVCRNYTWWDCAEYERDDKKHLPII